MAAREILDDEELSQYGTVTDDWRNQPRPFETDVSLLLGRWDPVSAGDVIRWRGGGALQDGTEVIRCTTAGTLRSAGFRVHHTPNRRNPDHVSVTAVGTWNSGAFERCFTEYQVAPEPVDQLEEEEI